MIQIDIEVPKTCLECPLHDGEYGWCNLNYDITMDCEERPKECPLHEVTDSDTISRQDAIDLIERYCDNGCEIAEDKWCPDCQQSQFAKMIKALPPSPSRPQWIPCSERLPEVTVLCCDTRGEMIIGYLYQDEESNTGYSAVLDDVVMIDCIAWMPLPEPYHRP